MRGIFVITNRPLHLPPPSLQGRKCDACAHGWRARVCGLILIASHRVVIKSAWRHDNPRPPLPRRPGAKEAPVRTAVRGNAALVLPAGRRRGMMNVFTPYVRKVGNFPRKSPRSPKSPGGLWRGAVAKNYASGRASMRAPGAANLAGSLKNRMPAPRDKTAGN